MTEHTIFALRIVIAVAIPTTPQWVHVAKLQLQRAKARRMNTPQELRAEQLRKTVLNKVFKQQLREKKLDQRFSGLRQLVDAEKRSTEE